MKTNNVKLYSPNFGMIKIPDRAVISEQITNAILDSKAIQNFGKKYNANVNLQMFQSKSALKGKNYGLVFEKVKPVGILRKFLIKVFPKFEKVDCFSFNSGVNSEEKFIKIIKEIDKNFFIKLHKKANTILQY